MHIIECHTSDIELTWQYIHGASFVPIKWGHHSVNRFRISLWASIGALRLCHCILIVIPQQTSKSGEYCKATIVCAWEFVFWKIWPACDRQQNVYGGEDLLQVSTWHGHSYIAGILLLAHALSVSSGWTYRWMSPYVITYMWAFHMQLATHSGSLQDDAAIFLV